jgi:ABC-type sugar transport system ATPase subunit
MQQSPLIDIRAVGKSFPGVQALNGVSLTLRTGEVHAVIGENGAGKSTLMNMLAGELLPDTGSIHVDGAEVRLSSPLKSKALGINVVFQELSLCQNLTVGENVMMQGLARPVGLSMISRSKAGREAVKLLGRLGLGDLDPATPVHQLTIAQMQLIEIARAISQDLRVLVLDEPNSALSPHETARMLQIIRALRSDGVAIVFVSHNLDEVRSIADRITVLRDGKHVVTMDNDVSVTVDRLVSAMVGRDLATVQQYSLTAPVADATEPVLAVQRLEVPGQINKISFELYRGEILGVAGMPNSGKDSLSDALFGLIPRGGTVEIGGVSVPAENPSASIASGMALIPADRRRGGALLMMSVAHNVVSSSLSRFSWLGLLRNGAIARTADDYVGQFDVRIASLAQRIRTLSGGNQQKVILARGLVTKPKLLILHEPTRGIDVGAKEEIYAILSRLASEGMAVIMISSELPEIVLHTSRVLVMEKGRIAATFSGAAITEEAIMQAAVGQFAVAAE